MDQSPRTQLYPWAYTGTFQHANLDPPTLPSSLNEAGSKTGGTSADSLFSNAHELDVGSKQTSNQPESTRNRATICVSQPSQPCSATTKEEACLPSSSTPDCPSSTPSPGNEGSKMAVDERLASRLKKDVAEGVRATLDHHAIDPYGLDHLSGTAEHLTPLLQHRQTTQFTHNSLKMQIERGVVSAMASSLRNAPGLESNPSSTPGDTTTGRSAASGANDPEYVRHLRAEFISGHGPEIAASPGQSSRPMPPYHSSQRRPPGAAYESSALRGPHAQVAWYPGLPTGSARSRAQRAEMRQRICSACRYMARAPLPPALAQEGEGFVCAESLKDRLMYYYGPITDQELLKICNTAGNASNGGGTLETRTVSGKMFVRWTPEEQSQRVTSSEDGFPEASGNSGAEQHGQCGSGLTSVAPRAGSPGARDLQSEATPAESNDDRKHQPLAYRSTSLETHIDWRLFPEKRQKAAAQKGETPAEADEACSKHQTAPSPGLQAREAVSDTPSPTPGTLPKVHPSGLDANNAPSEAASSLAEALGRAFTAALDPPPERASRGCDKFGAPIKDGNIDNPSQIHPALEVAYATLSDELRIFYASPDSPLYKMGSQRLDDNYHVVDTLKGMFEKWLVKRLWSVHGDVWCHTLLAERLARVIGWGRLTELVSHKDDDIHAVSDRWWRETKGEGADPDRIPQELSYVYSPAWLLPPSALSAYNTSSNTSPGSSAAQFSPPAQGHGVRPHLQQPHPYHQHWQHPHSHPYNYYEGRKVSPWYTYGWLEHGGDALPNHATPHVGSSVAVHPAEEEAGREDAAAASPRPTAGSSPVVVSSSPSASRPAVVSSAAPANMRPAIVSSSMSADSPPLATGAAGTPPAIVSSTMYDPSTPKPSRGASSSSPSNPPAEPEVHALQQANHPQPHNLQPHDQTAARRECPERFWPTAPVPQSTMPSSSSSTSLPYVPQWYQSNTVEHPAAPSEASGNTAANRAPAAYRTELGPHGSAAANAQPVQTQTAPAGTADDLVPACGPVYAGELVPGQAPRRETDVVGDGGFDAESVWGWGGSSSGAATAPSVGSDEGWGTGDADDASVGSGDGGGSDGRSAACDEEGYEFVVPGE